MNLSSLEKVLNVLQYIDIVGHQCFAAVYACKYRLNGYLVLLCGYLGIQI